MCCRMGSCALHSSPRHNDIPVQAKCESKIYYRYRGKNSDSKQAFVIRVNSRPKQCTHVAVPIV